MKQPRFYFVDVFAPRPLSGNPLAVVPDADDIPVVQMQAIAREFNQSETTFIVQPDIDGADWQLRSFTPIGAEVGGAGHNALGACLWLAQERLPQHQSRFVQQIGKDLWPVEIDRAGEALVVSMDQAAPEFGAAVRERDELARSLGLGIDDLADQDAKVVSTGAGHLMVPLRTSELVDRVQADRPRLAAVLRGVGGEGCYVYSLNDPDDEVHAYSRFFNPTMGIWEDPATGTAAGPLAARLVADGVVADGSTVVIEQGHATGRPSRLLVKVSGDLVRLSGGGLIVAAGTVRLETDSASTDPAKTFGEADATFLREAIGLAAESVRRGNPPYGSLLVAGDGRVLARERNTTVSDGDITAHPELKLARWAHRNLKPNDAGLSTLYTSCEPCTMCRNAIARSGITRVCFALSSAELYRLQPPGYVKPDAVQPTYLGPALREEAQVPIQRFFEAPP